MKRLFLLYALLFGLFVTNGTIAAKDFQTFTEISGEELSSSYSGNLTRVYMNSEKNPVSDKTSNVTQNASGTINISMDAFQIGSMPGTIAITANNIAVNADGTFSQTCNRCVTLRILGIPTRYTAFVEGTIKDGNLTYTITVNSEYSNAPFTAIVTFEGTK